MTVSAVVWDLDGTLVDSVVDIAGTVNHVLESYQLPVLSVDEVRVMVGNGASKLLDRAFDKADGSAIYNSEEAYQRFLEHYADHCCDNTCLYAGIADVLSGLMVAGCRQAVCTNKPEAMANQIISHLHLADTFSAVVGGDTTPFRKPHAAPLQRCFELMNSSADGALMIGDSAADVGVAQAAGVPVVLLPWGYTPEGIGSLGADYIVEDVEELNCLLHALVGVQSG